ncbi:hypothetical protein CLOM_g4217 [Closterium sp. NIES-68]|nr:hypothetical protein CLOM_g24619 [Closterium sp. NIES-68]GJP44802.1 hypothetical protein CLOM_g4217 [Closterium sp. NIES-68]GJP62889.1 hypothetical protein CLOP_g19959 [Closterium sp. NIES-67]GJP66730.1 hypothetical protein CLOP_g23635 [Closterium sp. NIES-67]
MHAFQPAVSRAAAAPVNPLSAEWAAARLRQQARQIHTPRPYAQPPLRATPCRAPVARKSDSSARVAAKKAEGATKEATRRREFSLALGGRDTVHHQHLNWAPRVYHHVDLDLSDSEKKGAKKTGGKKESVRRREVNGAAMAGVVSGDKAKWSSKIDGGREGGSANAAEKGRVERRGHYPDDSASHAMAAARDGGRKKKDYDYDDELERLQLELVKLQEWIRQKGLRVVVLFEGRDAAGKGGLIKAISGPLNPRVCSIKALGTPSDRERTQWYFQRYIAHLPSAGEMVLFDRSWYNRAGVEHVMGFCSDDEYREFLRSCPEFERMLVRSGIILVKYWVSVSAEEQERRFKERLARPEKRWKLSAMDLEARARWADYSYAKDVMFGYCDIKQAPWTVVPADDKKRARLNVLAHLLSLIPYEDLTEPESMPLPPLQEDFYVRPPVSDQTFLPQIY